MTKEEFKELLKANELTQCGFAKMVEMTPQGVNKWGKDVDVPKWAELLLQYRLTAGVRARSYMRIYP